MFASWSFVFLLVCLGFALCYCFLSFGLCAGGDPNEAKIRRLLEMGFDPVRTRAALAEAGGDESAAVSKLLSQG